ncbi:MAG: sigma-70 family RNA polymerase sigma factor [Candidatus Acidiferrales bacterium]
MRICQDVAVAYAASILRDHHLAEDAAQEAFLDAYRQLTTLREPAAFSSWLRTIVFKHCDRIIRKRQLLSNSLETAVDRSSTWSSPHDELESRAAAAAVWDAIGALPESERSVILLYYMGEQSQSSAAEFLDITENAVKARLYSARRRLRQFLTKTLHKSLQATRPSNDVQFSWRVMTTALSLQLFYVDQNGARQNAGSTVARRKLQIPQSATWFVEPRQKLMMQDWGTLIALINETRTPGISGAGQITDEALEHVSRCSHLTYLDLQNSLALTDQGLQVIARLPRLEHLILSGTKITDRGLAVLQRLPNLKTLDLCHQQYISDAGLMHLRNCESLERLNLMGTGTGNGAVEAVSGKAHLRQFFAGTSITDRGLERLGEFPLFAKWKDRRHDLSLMNFQHHPTYLWLNMKAPLTDAGLAHLGKLDGLSALNLFATTGHAPFDDTNSQVTFAGLSALIELANLRWLGCCARLCSDKAMQCFASMPNLRFLMCQDAVSGDNGFIALSRSSSVEFVWGRRCHNLRSAGFSALRNMPKLRGLAVSCRNVGDTGLATLPQFVALRQFMPIDVPDASFKYIGQCKQLEDLYCMYCPEATDEATHQISSLRLKTYQAFNLRITDESLRILSKMDSMEHVGLFNCTGVTDLGVAGLSALPRLQDLDLEQLLGVTRDVALVFPVKVRINYAN